MNLDELNEANINNLTHLWKKMGTQSRPAKSIKNLHVSVSWPNRCWLDWEAKTDEIPAIDLIFSRLDQNIIVPVWVGLAGWAGIHKKILIDGGFELSFEQTAMYFNLENYDVIGCLNPDIATISSERDIETWTNVAAQSFEYEIDVSVIRQIADDPDAQLLLTYVDGQPAATAMLFRTGDIIGVHQVGVSGEYRGKGVARTLMQYVIERCNELTANYITLQASAAGEYLYRNLGFKRQFMIQNYQRVIVK